MGGVNLHMADRRITAAEEAKEDPAKGVGPALAGVILKGQHLIGDGIADGLRLPRPRGKGERPVALEKQAGTGSSAGLAVTLAAAAGTSCNRIPGNTERTSQAQSSAALDEDRATESSAAGVSGSLPARAPHYMGAWPPINGRA